MNPRPALHSLPCPTLPSPALFYSQPSGSRNDSIVGYTRDVGARGVGRKGPEKPDRSPLRQLRRIHGRILRTRAPHHLQSVQLRVASSVHSDRYRALQSHRSCRSYQLVLFRNKCSQMDVGTFPPKLRCVALHWRFVEAHARQGRAGQGRAGEVRARCPEVQRAHTPFATPNGVVWCAHWPTSVCP